MSQFTINTPDYDRRLFGCPYEASEPQVTEPFWQQYPTWAQQEELLNSNTSTDNYYRFGMDSEPLFIGYNTKNGRKLPKVKQSMPANRARRDRGTPRAKGYVDVYVDGVFIQAVPLALLVRFSTTARDWFPRPTKVDEVKHERGKPLDWAEDGDNQIDMEKVTADLAKLGKLSQAGNTGLPCSESVERTMMNFGSQNKKLDVYLSQLWTQPPMEAFKFAFDWMYEARRTSNSDSILSYGVPDPDKLPLSKLVDLYAAALCFKLRPPPAKLRADLFTRLTRVPPSILDIKYIHEHLPVEDRVITRMVTSFLQNRGASMGVYSKTHRDEIEAYFYEVDDALYQRFQEIEGYRELRRKAHRREEGEDRLQKVAEGLEGGAEEGMAVHEDAGAYSSSKEAGVDKTGGRRRDRRKQQRKGDGLSWEARFAV